VLGHAYRNNLTSFAKLFSHPGHEAQIISLVQKLAREAVAAVRSEPENFLVLAMFSERERIHARWHESGISDAQIRSLETHFKMPIDKAFNNLQVAISTGIGLGSAMPELAERLWKNEHEGDIDPEKLERLRTAGLEIPDETPATVTLADRRRHLTSRVDQFVAANRPDLLTEIKLNH
jgi:hypothetical protein